jgi:hypothetical protein
MRRWSVLAKLFTLEAAVWVVLLLAALATARMR